ncbi:MAG TPA: hypothetical protein VIB79_02220 [Candidatus Binatia bacterium]|jgi:hypothetical protein
MFSKKNVKTLLVGSLFAAAFGVGVSKANAFDNQSPNQNPWVQSSIDEGSYCHLKFPAVRQSTINTDRPQLKQGTGDLVDYYGPCDHDPLSSDELTSQRDELDLQWEMNYGSE